MRLRRSLIRATKVEEDGIVFDSKKEHARYRELKMLEAAGEITDLKAHTSYALKAGGREIRIRSKGYPNGRVCIYTDDFSYTVKRTAERVYEDVKGYDTPKDRLRRAVFEACYGVEVRIIQ